MAIPSRAQKIRSSFCFVVVLPWFLGRSTAYTSFCGQLPSPLLSRISSSPDGRISAARSKECEADPSDRRRQLFRLGEIVAFSALFLNGSANAAILQVEPCTSGTGEGCADLSEGNNYIRTLQQKSAEKREFYAKQALEAYNMKNYPDYFASMNPPRFLVKKSDGSFEAYTDHELSELKKAGKIAVEQPNAMGGKVTDYTRKPTLVLKE